MTNTSASIKPLTSIRGLAALWVYLYHCQFLNSGSTIFNNIVHGGYFGVDIFFILSGFIITYVHRDDFPTFRDVKKNTARFLGLRLSRIYPLHIITLLAVLALQLAGIFGSENATASDFIQNLFLVQSWGLADKMSWNVVAWSISVEWFLYLLFPFLAWGIATKAKDALNNLLLIGLALSLWMVYFYASGLNISNMYLPGLSIPHGVLDFVIGIALCNLFRLQFLKKLPWDALAILSVVGLLTAVQWNALKGKPIPYNMTMIILSTLAVYSFANIRSYGHYFFSNRPVVYLGTISYSLYMFHWIYVVLISMHHQSLFSEPSFFTPQFIIMTGGLVGISALSFHGIENPARKWARHMITACGGKIYMKKTLIVPICLAIFAAASFVKTFEGLSRAPAQRVAVASAEIQNTKADPTDPVLQYNLGVDYYSGHGVAQDYTEAARLWRKSAERGNLPSVYSLGNLYQNGLGVKQDSAEAVNWYRKGAEQGYADAQFALGKHYVDGDGIKKDNIEGYFWLLLSTVSGNQAAVPFRDQAAALLTSQQTADVQKRAQMWKLNLQ